MPGPSAPSKIFERDQKILNVVKKFWTCSKFFGRVQKIWMWCKITRNGKNLKKNMYSKFLNMAKIFLNTSKNFQHIQNFLNMFKNFWTEQMDRALEKKFIERLKTWKMLQKFLHYALSICYVQKFLNTFKKFWMCWKILDVFKKFWPCWKILNTSFSSNSFHF